MKKRKTLGENDIVVDRALGRRSALAAIATVGLGATAIATTTFAAGGVAHAKASDSDPNDPAGRGRGPCH